MLYILPVFVLVILIIGFVKGVACFDSFLSGAKDGILTIVKLLPSLIGLIVSIGVFRASGMLEVIVNLASPVFEYAGLSGDVLPLVLIRPISGSASLAILKGIIDKVGAESLAAKSACVMMGSTETIFYTLAVYTDKTKIKRLPGVLPAALFGNLISAILAGVIMS